MNIVWYDCVIWLYPGKRKTKHREGKKPALATHSAILFVHLYLQNRAMFSRSPFMDRESRAPID